MAAEVFYASSKEAKRRSLLNITEKLYDRLKIDNDLEKDDFIAVKVHFGEEGNTAFLPPIYSRRIIQKLKSAGTKPFLTDANTLYRGSRGNAVDHIETAINNGFSYATVNAPIVIADGLLGQDFFKMDYQGKHFKELKVARTAYQADGLIAMTHFKAHEATGIGGTLKNIGMGLGSRGAKQQMHSDLLPQVNMDKCSACGKCEIWCPSEAIMIGEYAIIDKAKCIGCGECTVICPEEAISIHWKTEEKILQEKIVEYVDGIISNKNNKVAFFNFLLQITPDCDCWGWSDHPFVDDIGILASRDPIAIDQASADLVNSTQGLEGSRLSDISAEDKIRTITGVDWRAQLRYGEEIGLGTRKYELKEI